MLNFIVIVLALALFAAVAKWIEAKVIIKELRAELEASRVAQEGIASIIAPVRHIVLEAIEKEREVLKNLDAQKPMSAGGYIPPESLAPEMGAIIHPVDREILDSLKKASNKVDEEVAQFTNNPDYKRDEKVYTASFIDWPQDPPYEGMTGIDFEVYKNSCLFSSEDMQKTLSNLAEIHNERLKKEVIQDSP